MRFRRLKTTNGTGTIMRYYEIASDELAKFNEFYEIVENKAVLLEAGDTPAEGSVIGFSHGGNKLAKGLVFLDINPEVVYMAILETGDNDRPNIGDVIDGYKKVIYTHYEEDKIGMGTELVGEIDGKDVMEWGVENIDAPYYLFTTGNLYDSEIHIASTISSESTNSEVAGAKAVYDLITQTIDSSSGQGKVPSAKAVYDYIDLMITQAIGGSY